MASDHCLLGSHESTAGGLAAAVARAEHLRCEAVQIFVKSPSRWQAPALAQAECLAFRERFRESRLQVAIAHAAYLPNLASPDLSVWQRSVAAVEDELFRSAALGLSALVVHPGAHMGSGVEAGLARVVAALDRLETVRRQVRGVRLLLELTAGQGTALGREPKELGWILHRVAEPEGLGLCLDTCHVFAAGFNLCEEEGYGQLLEEISASCGLGCVRALHLNDSAAPCGSRRDRHANLGEGKIGWEGLLRVVGDPRWTGLPAILETPLGPDGAGHARDLRALERRLRPLSGSSGQRPKRLARSK